MVFKVGNIPHNKGKKSSEETREKISLNHWDSSGDKNPMFGKTGELSPLFGKKQLIEWQEKKSKALTGRKRPDLSEQFRGTGNSNWKGGVTPLRKSIRDCSKTAEWRASIFERDLYTCQECGKSGCYIEAHHKKGFGIIITEHNIASLEEALNCDEMWDINNGITLCKPCHDKLRTNVE